MMDLFGDPAIWLPAAFATLMGLSILIYVVLDGFDLGVGLLLPLAENDEKDRMIASIGPFWDANETWLVLAVGLLLVAFPMAHGMILTALYIPVTIMLIGIILRGVAFEFRAKAPYAQKRNWDRAFFAGSAMTCLSQGYMLGNYIMGLEQGVDAIAFSLLTGLCLTVGFSFIGATWLLMKTESELQLKSAQWARRGLVGAIAGLAAVSIASPLASPRIFEKWFAFPEVLLLAPLPLTSAAIIAGIWIALRQLPTASDSWNWVPFAAATGLFALAFAGLAYSFYPYIVPEKLTIYEAASAPESLFIILIGALFVVPAIGGYTALSYYIFRGKATELTYE